MPKTEIDDCVPRQRIISDTTIAHATAIMCLLTTTDDTSTKTVVTPNDAKDHSSNKTAQVTAMSVL